ncbi:Abscisic acid responsive elements-binding factor 2 isoform 1 [Tripterygium wilfordii]|uniref:Abscisic acid responsive elements-binding factor 2 isoform 1 n=1 Tax=Tripterygium wilfordii TaxID=458696 RepID=A0A7J7D2V8_TRIWF|nr:ABSCISIC ACID-INSENSITIVE 5-like protein 5 [Tripterygium wilfordii]XP_038715880.1 ABSCISIC ACID-INSENSITIVE 5-like protein 5 [Tripterygium wilfordii]XP_038715881.1 ABSCISIC ACID-INSENSITIVE 5-like protein 5 [Tripterygium wilfordii]XP_038715882.1 ABSCISIC ACID-INSENSITIVE 5-like protein 5 [Tripterygium wilfordii]KAF5740677.1 Abscisic acid responsive elements-binding factor 2 isoform 1 [Tripterygium wilfordii]
MFKNLGNDPPGDGGGNRPLGNFELARQQSIYSLTFDELQNTMGGSVGKDFGSMNMDELLKNIWTAEETQSMTMTSTSGAGQEGQQLQRQGSLTLPRTLSQKTVDEVWREIANDHGVGKDGHAVVGANANYPQRQQTLGEMTLEEFLLRAGVVREDIQMGGKVGNGGFFGDLSRTVNNNSGFGIGLQQMGRGAGLMGNWTSETNNNGGSSNNQGSMQSNLPLNVNGVRLNQNQLSQAQLSQQQQPQQPQIFPKQPAVGGYMTKMPIQSGLASPGIRGGIVGFGDQGMNGTGLQGGGMGMMGLGAGAGPLSSPANQLSSDVVGKSNGDSSSVSPVPYVFNGGLRGRRSNGAVEKVVERRQRRMIKNRESAARSRARKQAYTTELEAEVAKLKEENQELRKKQAKIMEMQKDQVLEMMNTQQGGKKRCLRRTQTGPW